MSPRWDAADYANHSQGQFNWAMSVIHRLGLHGCERVLDVGCGDGKVTAAITARVPEGSVLGIDKSAEMIALAVRNSADRSKLSFRAVDAQTLVLDARFDVVFSNAALHWVEDLDAVFAGLARALTPGETPVSFDGRARDRSPGLRGAGPFAAGRSVVRLAPDVQSPLSISIA